MQGARQPARTPGRLRRVGFRLAALLVGTTFALLLLELGLRVAGLPEELERRSRAFDPVYSQVRADSWIFDFAIDPKRHHAVDLRGQRVAIPKPPGKARVLFIGDSATEGAFVELSQSFPRRFAALWHERRPGSALEVINAGVWGMTTIDEYYLLKDKLLALQPDLVVLGVFMANDINWNLGHPQRQLRYRSVRPIDWLRRRSALVQFLFMRTIVANDRFGLLPSSLVQREAVPVELSLVDSYGLDMLSYPAGELALYMRKPSRLVERAWTLLGDVLWRLAALGRAHGFELRVLLIPSPSTVTRRLNILHYPNLLQDLRAQGVDIDRGQLDFGLPLSRALALCERLRLVCVDPSHELRPLGLSAFFPGDEHPSVAGHEALARALLERL